MKWLSNNECELQQPSLISLFCQITKYSPSADLSNSTRNSLCNISTPDGMYKSNNGASDRSNIIHFLTPNIQHFNVTILQCYHRFHELFSFQQKVLIVLKVIFPQE